MSCRLCLEFIDVHYIVDFHGVSIKICLGTISAWPCVLWFIHFWTCWSVRNLWNPGKMGQTVRGTPDTNPDTSCHVWLWFLCKTPNSLHKHHLHYFTFLGPQRRSELSTRRLAHQSTSRHVPSVGRLSGTRLVRKQQKLAVEMLLVGGFKSFQKY